jgi:hypothetical protein
MMVPDGLVWVSIPVLAGAIGKASQWFVQDVISTSKRANRDNAKIDERAQGRTMSITDFEQIGTLLKQELNGRYMLATEAREKFAAISHQIDAQANDLRNLLINRPEVIPVPRPSGKGNATADGEGLVSGGR